MGYRLNNSPIYILMTIRPADTSSTRDIQVNAQARDRL